MRVGVITNRKGGVGKSTITALVAIEAEAAGHTVAIIDLDPQANLAKWADTREGDTPVVISAHSTRLPQILHTAEANGITLALLDTPPNVEDVVKDAVKAASFAIVPCRPGRFDLEAIGATLKIIKDAKIPARIVFNAVPSRSSILMRVRKAIATYGVPIAPILLNNRVAFEYALIDSQVAQEYEPKGKAADEARLLYKYIAKEMEI